MGRLRLSSICGSRRSADGNQLVAEAAGLAGKFALQPLFAFGLAGLAQGVVKLDLPFDEGIEDGGDLSGRSSDSAGLAKSGLEAAEVIADRGLTAMQRGSGS